MELKLILIGKQKKNRENKTSDKMINDIEYVWILFQNTIT